LPSERDKLHHCRMLSLSLNTGSGVIAVEHYTMRARAKKTAQALRRRVRARGTRGRGTRLLDRLRLLAGKKFYECDIALRLGHHGGCLWRSGPVWRRQCGLGWRPSGTASSTGTHLRCHAERCCTGQLRFGANCCVAARVAAPPVRKRCRPASADAVRFCTRWQVSFRQRGNPVLEHIKNVRWQVRPQTRRARTTSLVLTLSTLSSRLSSRTSFRTT
jgi:hypothetical protein